jgi:1-deoxy-D-xylulose-5-phosphate synthase
LGNQVLNLGIPDAFIEHATHSEMLMSCGLDAQGIHQAILARL